MCTLKRYGQVVTFSWRYSQVVTSSWVELRLLKDNRSYPKQVRPWRSVTQNHNNSLLPAIQNNMALLHIKCIAFPEQECLQHGPDTGVSPGLAKNVGWIVFPMDEGKIQYLRSDGFTNTMV